MHRPWFVDANSEEPERLVGKIDLHNAAIPVVYDRAVGKRLEPVEIKLVCGFDHISPVRQAWTEGKSDRLAFARDGEVETRPIASGSVVVSIQVSVAAS
jgi:hypothetical protein